MNIDNSINACYPKIGELLQMKNMNSVILKYCSAKEISSINDSSKLLNAMTNDSPRWKQELERLQKIINQGARIARGEFYEKYGPCGDQDEIHRCGCCDGYLVYNEDWCNPCTETDKPFDGSLDNCRKWVKRHDDNTTVRGVRDQELENLIKMVEKWEMSPDEASDWRFRFLKNAYSVY